MSQFVALDRIDRHPDADLFPHDAEHVERLAADIEDRGITTPVHVTPQGDRFLLLTGHDRVEAARRAGLAEVPAEVRSTVLSDDDRWEYFAKDNTLRKDVDKRAVAMAAWRRWPDSTIQRIADRAGVSLDTAHRARVQMREDGIFDVENTRTDAIGRERPRAYAPRDNGAEAGSSGATADPTGDGNEAGGATLPAEAPDTPVPTGDVNTAEPEASDDGDNKLAVHHSSESGEWYTPEHIINAVADALDGIDLDPCSNPGEPAVPAERHFTYMDDGLAQEWAGRVYMNPPYGRGIGEWTEKLRAEYEDGDVTAAVALLPARTDTAWMHDLREYARCFIKGRISFSGHENAAPFPSLALYMGPEPERFTEAFADLGDTYALMGV